MAGWRQVSWLRVGDGNRSIVEIEAPTALSRSRHRKNRPGRCRAAAMLLGYREKPSFFAAGTKTWRASSDGAAYCAVARPHAPMASLAALDDRPRPGKEPDDHAGGQGLVEIILGLRQLVKIAHGYPIMTTQARHFRLRLRHARERGPAAGHQCHRPSGSRHRVRSFSVKRKSSCDRAVRYAPSECASRTPSSSPRWRKVLCVYRVEVQSPEKSRCSRRRNRRSRSRSSFLSTRSLESQAIATTAFRICRAVPGRHASFARDHEYKRHGIAQPVGQWDRSGTTGQGPTRSSGSDHRSREFIFRIGLKLVDAAYPASTARSS